MYLKFTDLFSLPLKIDLETQCREGGEYNTRKGNNPGRLFAASEPLGTLSNRNFISEKIKHESAMTNQLSTQTQLSTFTFEQHSIRTLSINNEPWFVAKDFTEYELEQMIWLWFGHKQMNELLGKLDKPLEAMGSRFHPIVYSHHHEYERQHKALLDTMRRLIEPFKKSERLNWQRMLPHLN